MTNVLILASDFSGLAAEAFLFFVLVLTVVILAIAGIYCVLRRRKSPDEANLKERPKIVDSIWHILAWFCLVIGSFAIMFINNLPLHELLFSRRLRAQNLLPSISIVVVGIVLCLLAQRNTRKFGAKALLWLMLLWYGYLATALGLAMLRG